jgi:hypothetical protein
MTQRRTRLSHARWLEHIYAQEASGLSSREYCLTHDLREGSFLSHRTRACRKNSTAGGGGFTEVRLGGGSGLRLSPVGAAWSLELDRGFDPETLRRFLGVLGA